MKTSSSLLPHNFLAVSGAFESAVAADSISREKVSITEARAIIDAATRDDGVISASEAAQLASNVARYEDRFTAGSAMEFAFLAQQAGVEAGSDALPRISAGRGTGVVLDAFETHLTRADDGSTKIGIASVRAAISAAFADGRLTTDEKVGLALIGGRVAAGEPATAMAAREVAELRAKYRLPALEPSVVSWI